mmetsp:Transcript_26036/g.58437  ORF Transcript_26036/g.58437 Transcript_26036/m.58437 type:complete len:229 (+) Transcript_26036:644-1330(+)
MSLSHTVAVCQIDKNFCLIQSSTWMWPCTAAARAIKARLQPSKGGVCAPSHSSTCRWPAAPAASPSIFGVHGQGGSCTRSHSRISTWPPLTAAATVFPSQGQGGSCACIHCSTSTWPPSAAAAQVMIFHGQGGLWVRIHCSTSTWPAPAAAVVVSAVQAAGRFCARAHLSTSRWPPLAASSQSPLSGILIFILAHCNRETDATKSRRTGRTRGTCSIVALQRFETSRS